MRQSWKWSALMAVVLPGGIVIAAAWLMSKYLGERGASPASTGGQGARRRDRWDWPQSRGQAGNWSWPRSMTRAGRWDWPTGGSRGAGSRAPSDERKAS